MFTCMCKNTNVKYQQPVINCSVNTNLKRGIDISTGLWSSSETVTSSEIPGGSRSLSGLDYIYGAVWLSLSKFL